MVDGGGYVLPEGPDPVVAFAFPFPAADFGEGEYHLAGITADGDDGDGKRWIADGILTAFNIPLR
jgi:hypothetical protein